MKLVAFLAVFCIAQSAAALPDVVTYAARVEDDAGPVDGNVSVSFTLFGQSAGGTALWTEFVASAVVVGGDLVHELGSIEPLDAGLLARDDVFLEVTINGDTLAPRLALRAVPYALLAADANTVGGVAAADLALRAELPTVDPTGGLVSNGGALGIGDRAITRDMIGLNQIRAQNIVEDAFDNLLIRPAACGGGLQRASLTDTAGTCKSLMCGISGGAARFFACAGNNPACDQTASQTCSFDSLQPPRALNQIFFFTN